MSTAKPVVLCILDGWGLSDTTEGNAPVLAATPNFDAMMASCPNATLITHGPDVGLPTGQMGNSEVGHTNIGAGRVVAMDLGQIDLAIEDGSFFGNEAIVDFAKTLKASGGTAHVMGVVSDGGVHGHLNHMTAAIKAITDAGVPLVVHAIADGRDVAPKSALPYFAALEDALPDTARIGTVVGRYYALDRDNRWERVSEAYQAMVHGEGLSVATAAQAIQDGYAREETDEFIKASVVGDFAGFKAGDGCFCLNFRADRAREILAAMGQPGFDAFDIGARPDVTMLGMVDYSDEHVKYMASAYPKKPIPNTLGEWVAKQGKSQFRLAETEKYPHVTFFLNGGEETPFEGEDRFMPKSPKVATYDLQPEMSAAEVTEKFVGAIEQGYDLIVTNYANPDMVGHTGDLDAAMAACEAVDTGLGAVRTALEKVGGTMIVTADHGNCEVMIDPETKEPHPAHTTNLVPVILVNGPEGASLKTGRLADLAPSLLELMDLPTPEEMTGESLIQR